jgi:carnosine synthase
MRSIFVELEHILDFDPNIADETSPTSPLHGKRILFVMGGDKGKLALYQHIVDLGVKCVVIDGERHWSKDYPALFEAVLECNFVDFLTNSTYVLSVIQNSGLKFDAVATFDEYATLLVAHIAQELGLPGQTLHSVNLARNKVKTRKLCQATDIPTPRFHRIRSADDLRSAADYVDFPAVLKHTRSTTRCEEYRVDSYGELVARFAEIERKVSSTDRDNLIGITCDDLMWIRGIDLMLEEYLDGDDFDVTCLLADGNMVFASVISGLHQPGMVEAYGHLPTAVPQRQQAELIALAQDTLDAMGFRDGVFHVETNYSSDGPQLVQVNPHFGNRSIYDMNKCVWGVDLAKQYLLTCLRLPIRPQPARDPLTYLASHMFVAPRCGIVSNADFLAHLADDPRVVYVKTHVQNGQIVTGPERGVPTWLGEVIVCGMSQEDAERTLQSVILGIELPIA